MNTEEKLKELKYIILIRHGLKDDNKSPDEKRPLSIEGRHQVALLGERLAENLAKRNLNLRVFFTSPYSHSMETAVILKCKLGGKSVVSLENLKPYNKKRITFSQLIEEIKEKDKKINLESSLEVVAFVGHYPSLWDLQWSLKKDQINAPKPAEAFGFKGTVLNFCKGKGQFEFHEVQDINEIEEIEANRNHRIEEQLRSKITSTMTVSTFLAGFTFTVLNDLLKNDLLKNDLLKTTCLNIFQSLAAISMTISLSLFIASLYMYDNMAMPKEYWPPDRASFYPHHKILRDYMIRTWNWVFTPGVVCFIFGFIATLFKTWDINITFRRKCVGREWVGIVGTVIIVAMYVVIRYCWRRMRLVSQKSKE